MVMSSLPITLAEILSVSAALKLHLPPGSNSCLPPLRSPNLALAPKNKYRTLLNGMAMLLVTEAASDVAAGTITNYAKGDKIITRFYAVKNRQCTAMEQAYYQYFIRTLNDQSIDSPTRMHTLMNLIISNCRGKIIHRLLKFQHALKDSKGTIKPWREPDGMMEPDVISLKTFVHQSSNPDASWSEYLEDLFTKVLDPEDFMSTSDGKALWVAYLFVRNPSLLGSIGSPKVVSRLRKLAQYVATLISIDKQVKHWKGKRVFELHIGSLECMSLNSISTNLILAPIFPKNHSSINSAPYYPCQ